jgi:hypothetical protein
MSKILLIKTGISTIILPNVRQGCTKQTVDPLINDLIGGMCGPIMLTVWYF